jgi:DNA-directed RNA polymerase specialized sigma24 family protein
VMHAELKQRLSQRLGADGAQFIELILENHDWNEIGRVLNVPPDTARMRWRRCLKRVRRELDVESESGA